MQLTFTNWFPRREGYFPYSTGPYNFNSKQTIYTDERNQSIAITRAAQGQGRVNTVSELLNISRIVVRVSETRYCHFFIFFSLPQVLARTRDSEARAE